MSVSLPLHVASTSTSQYLLSAFIPFNIIIIVVLLKIHLEKFQVQLLFTKMHAKG